MNLLSRNQHMTVLRDTSLRKILLLDEELDVEEVMREREKIGRNKDKQEMWRDNREIFLDKYAIVSGP